MLNYASKSAEKNAKLPNFFLFLDHQNKNTWENKEVWRGAGKGCKRKGAKKRVESNKLFQLLQQ
jgi:hypothetical protein